MRLGDEQESVNFEDRSGQRFGGGGFGGGGLPMMLIGLVASRFGIVGVLVLALGYCALSSLGGSGDMSGTPSQVQSGPAAATTVDPATRTLVLRVLGSTERQWTRLFAARNAQYQPAPIVFYTQTNRSGCGIAQAAMGPFYCPTDQKIYLDVSFFDELQNRFGASGDFAQAYVIAHEVGHHIQKLTGVLDSAQRAQQGVSAAEANAIQVKVELQADCYAGVWGGNARDAQGRSLLEPGDVQEGLGAASAIGDDNLQRQSQGQVSPESFTHGSAKQRSEWLRRGLESGDPAQCDTFAT